MEVVYKQLKKSRHGKIGYSQPSRSETDSHCKKAAEEGISELVQWRERMETVTGTAFHMCAARRSGRGTDRHSIHLLQ